MILLIDNYDSFTYNLAQLIKSVGYDVCVKRNDEIEYSFIDELGPQAIVISPGPKGPKESGACIDIVKRFAGSLPILGVCLGCQIIACSFGAKIVRAEYPLHGESSYLVHNDSYL